jgi:transcriptional enhancer factor
MQHSRPVVPSQRYSPDDEYNYDTQHEVIPTTRQPLGESTGNVQAHNLATLALCQQNQISLSPPVHTIPTPPILPTQALPSTFGTSFRNCRSLHRDVSLRESPMGYPRGSKNPIYAYKHFADYRSKVMQKELEKEQPIWPLWLEDAFLDGKPTSYQRINKC